MAKDLEKITSETGISRLPSRGGYDLPENVQTNANPSKIRVGYVAMKKVSSDALCRMIRTGRAAYEKTVTGVRDTRHRTNATVIGVANGAFLPLFPSFFINRASEWVNEYSREPNADKRAVAGLITAQALIMAATSAAVIAYAYPQLLLIPAVLEGSKAGYALLKKGYAAFQQALPDAEQELRQQSSGLLHAKVEQKEGNCPFCSAPPLSPVKCLHCETPHCGECWVLNGGCAMFGCKPKGTEPLEKKLYGGEEER